MPKFDDRNYTVFRTRLAALIESHGYSLKGLSPEIGITDVTLSRYMTGSRTPELPYIIRIAEFFGVSVDWLIGFNGERYDVIPEDIQELIHLYSLASKDDRLVVKAVLQKYKEVK